MRKVANDSSEELQQLFSETAIRRKLTPGVVEKDFWVCWMLDYLFNVSKLKETFEFKGGTSLSKAFGIIERMSEDIDLILDWRALELNDADLWMERSNTKQGKFVEQINRDTATYLRDVLQPRMDKDFAMLLNKEYSLITLEEEQTIAFSYPRIYDETSVLQEIRLEIGVLGAWAPTTTRSITPYVAEDFPSLFSLPHTSIRTVDASRTFWEKVTILHKEAFREKGQISPQYSRHYYDMYMLSKSEIFEDALERVDLLKQVVDFKAKFYYAKNAHYELAKIGSVKLLPPNSSLSILEADYNSMRNMIFGSYPSFDEILSALADTERHINRLN